MSGAARGAKNISKATSQTEICRAAKLLFEPGAVVEVRVPNAGSYKTLSGYYDDPVAMVDDIVRLDARIFSAIYWTMNSVSRSLSGRAYNRIKNYAKHTTSDHDITHRRWLLIDADPKRPADISSSDAEHQAALALASTIQQDLAAAGWPEPIYADSGNGAHLLYRIELSNNEESTALVRDVLTALATRYNSDIVVVDSATYNASRIVKVYGTTARKGDNIDERPHRISKILTAPAEAHVVPIDLLRALAGQYQIASGAHRSSVASSASFDLTAFLDRHGVRYRPPVACEGGRKFVLEECPWDPLHTAPDAAVFEGADGKLGFRCFHNSCDGRGWHDFRNLLQSRGRTAGASTPGAAPDRADDLNTGRAARSQARHSGGHGIDVHSGAPSIFNSVAPYPAPLGENAYYGIAGCFVRLVERHTEADPSFMLIQFLAYAGNVIGRDAFVWAGADRHHSNIFLCGVGPTSAGRKGSAAGPCQLFFKDIDEDWVHSIQSGLSSGEGLIWCVRDPIYRREKMNQGKGKAAQYEEVMIDSGVSDKRLLVHESEFFGPLQAMRRQGNTLSPVMRSAFDKGNLNSMVKNSPGKATDAHISIVGNITKEELLRAMLVDEMDNGFANRFLWACSRRSRCLPEGGRMWEVIESEPFRNLQKDFNRIHHAVKGSVNRDAEASDIWGYDDKPYAGVYGDLTKERHGMYGACTARAAALTLRLSLIYALLDGANEIRKEHLIAALEVWRYCDESARFIFGGALGDPTADAILRALRAAPGGLTRTEITALFDRHKSATELDRALMVLHTRGLVRFDRQPTKGRTLERWFAVWQTEIPA